MCDISDRSLCCREKHHIFLSKEHDLTFPLQNILYSSRADTFSAWWTGFGDTESGIRDIKIRLLSAEDSCTASDIVNMTAVVDSTELSANSTSYEFANLKLEVIVAWLLPLF